jgi:hypothetical protein
MSEPDRTKLPIRRAPYGPFCAPFWFSTERSAPVLCAPFLARPGIGDNGRWAL